MKAELNDRRYEDSEGLWSSWSWQQGALTAAVVTGLVLAIKGVDVMYHCHHHIHGDGLVLSIVGLALFTIAVYGGWSTRWLTREDAPLPGKIAAGVAIGIGAVIWVIGLLGAIFGDGDVGGC
ncbi:MAG: hypothetical protein ACE5JL_02770 [Dehalococcoidia bacterium]